MLSGKWSVGEVVRWMGMAIVVLHLWSEEAVVKGTSYRWLRPNSLVVTLLPRRGLTLVLKKKSLRKPPAHNVF